MESVQKVVSRAAWSAPRRFRLQKTVGGERYDDVYCVLFNRRPLARRKEIRLSNFVDVRIIAKFLSVYAWEHKSPVTLFEAWESDASDRIYWIPVQPLGARQLGASTHYRETCTACRGVFEKEAIRVLDEDFNRKEECPHFRDCPAGRACLDESDAKAHISDRCLQWLEARERCCPCYQSDLEIIRGMVEGFHKGRVSRIAPHEGPCWVGYREIAFPVVVHGHLVGAVMIGQFDTDQSPKTPADFIERERQWRHSRNDAFCPEPLLAADPNILSSAFAKWRDSEAREYRLTEKQSDYLRQDVEQLAALTEERYLRHRHLNEAAFRLELGGTLPLRLLRGDDFEELLPHLLCRMRDFWAFEHVCSCIMQDWEDHPRLHAANDHYFPTPGVGIEVPDFAKTAGEYRAQAVVLGPANGTSGQQSPWGDFLAKLAEVVPEIKSSVDRQSLHVIVCVGSRSHVFSLLGRNMDQVSRLPYRSEGVVRLSSECRDQVMRTCEQVVGHLHNFWARYDHEQAYRVVSHTLRTPVTLMKKGSGTLRRLTEKHRHGLQHRFPNLYVASKELWESLRLGSEVVDGELKSLGAVANLDSLVEKALAGRTDLAAVLRQLQPQCMWRSRLGSRLIKRPVTWDFRVSGTAMVRGHIDAIRLAVRNVLDNAFKYSFSGRSIDVEIANTSIGPELVVKNRGVPVEPEELERVWQRDFRGVHARRRKGKAEEGTGYGLFIVKEILEASGGYVSMESRILSHGEKAEGETTVRLQFARPKEN